MGAKNAERMLGKEGWKPTGKEAKEAGLITEVNYLFMGVTHRTNIFFRPVWCILRSLLNINTKSIIECQKINFF